VSCASRRPTCTGSERRRTLIALLATLNLFILASCYLWLSIITEEITCWFTHRRSIGCRWYLRLWGLLHGVCVRIEAIASIIIGWRWFRLYCQRWGLHPVAHPFRVVKTVDLRVSWPGPIHSGLNERPHIFGLVAIAQHGAIIEFVHWACRRKTVEWLERLRAVSSAHTRQELARGLGPHRSCSDRMQVRLRSSWDGLK